MLSNSVYDKLKHLAQVGIPALGALYFGLSQIWGLPTAEEVVGTLVLIDTFLGVLLGFSTRSYNESDRPYSGEIVVEEDLETGRLVYGLELDGAPDEIKDMDTIAFKVVNRN
jgi:hypothetical protein